MNIVSSYERLDLFICQIRHQGTPPVELVPGPDQGWALVLPVENTTAFKKLTIIITKFDLVS